MRLRELAVAAMVEATAKSRIDIASKTQTRRDGREQPYSTGDLVDFYRKPKGVHAKDSPVWIGPATICDVSTLAEGTVSVRWNGQTILCSTGTTRPHVVFPVELSYLT